MRLSQRKWAPYNKRGHRNCTTDAHSQPGIQSQIISNLMYHMDILVEFLLAKAFDHRLFHG